MNETATTKPRRPWIAVLLTFVTPGLGHLYAGYPAAAAAAYGAALAAIGCLFAFWLLVPVAPLNIWLGLAIFLSVIVAIPVHAAILARRRGAAYELRPYNRWYVYLGLYVLLAWVIAPQWQRELRKSVEAFRIPSKTMEPTLMVGDYLYAIKTAAARTQVTNGSVVVFTSVEEPDLKIVKRVVGMPGDTLAMQAGRLRRNGRDLTESYAVHHNPTRSEEPAQRAQMRAWQLAYVTGLDTASYAPDLQDWGPIVVPRDSFFVLGDNRDASYDSRYYGFIARHKIVGQPRVIYLSLDRGRVRWSRIGQHLALTNPWRAPR